MTTIEIPDVTIVAVTLSAMLCGIIVFVVFLARLLATEKFMAMVREHVTIHVWEKILPLHHNLTPVQRAILKRVEGLDYSDVDAALSSRKAVKALASHQLHSAQEMANVINAYEEGHNGYQPPHRGPQINRR